MTAPIHRLIESYARWRSSPLGQITDRLESDLLFELLGPVCGRKVLDVGCGDGKLAAVLARRGAVVTAVDADLAMLAAARCCVDTDGLGVRLCRADGARLPFDDSAFDCATAVTMLCFVDSPEPVLAEMARVLRPGGTLVIGELGRRSLWGAHRRVRAFLGDATWRAATFRTASELKKLIEDAGLVVLKTRGAVFYPPHARVARLLASLDQWLGQKSTFGAAFIGISASKPDKKRERIT